MPPDLLYGSLESEFDALDPSTSKIMYIFHKSYGAIQ